MFIHILFALIIGITVGGVAGYLGSLMLSKRMSLIADPLGHLTLPGMAIAFAYGFDVSLGALLFLVVGSAIIWLLEQRTKLPVEAITAIVFATSLAVSFLILPKKKHAEALLGDISQISFLTVLVTVIAVAAIFLIMRHIYSKMVLLSISPDLAQTNGVNIKLYNFIYLTCIAVTIALGVRIVGGLMTSAIVAIPACTSRNISHNLQEYSYTSLVAGALSCGTGILFSIVTGLPVGPLIIISSAILFVISLFVRPNQNSA
jgi:ABC-type Mn2+/Zn2+ transport system permease subunit